MLTASVGLTAAIVEVLVSVMLTASVGFTAVIVEVVVDVVV